MRSQLTGGNVTPKTCSLVFMRLRAEQAIERATKEFSPIDSDSVPDSLPQQRMGTCKTDQPFLPKGSPSHVSVHYSDRKHTRWELVRERGIAMMELMMGFSGGGGLGKIFGIFG